MKKQRTSDVSLNTEDPIDVYLEFQRGPSDAGMDEDMEDDERFNEDFRPQDKFGRPKGRPSGFPGDDEFI